MNNDTKRTKKNLALPDFAAMLATILVTLAEGVEAGLMAGVALDLLPKIRSN